LLSVLTAACYKPFVRTKKKLELETASISQYVVKNIFEVFRNRTNVIIRIVHKDVTCKENKRTLVKVTRENIDKYG